MILKKYVIDNIAKIVNEYTISQDNAGTAKINPRHAARNRPYLNKIKTRLYIPFSLNFTAGYIDLDAQTVKIQPTRWADPKAQLRKLITVLHNLKTDCYVKNL